tara:strand:- start:7653 stop:8258 length:606 start_codon:yes stop_codon:yes gene_type:complete
MMAQIKKFLLLTLLGGIAVVLPGAILAMLFGWLFNLTRDLISPLTALISARTAYNEWVAGMLVVILIIGSCFLIGLLVRTGLGAWLHSRLDRVLGKLAPGYRIIRELVDQFFGDQQASLFSGEVALARIYGADVPVTVTAIVTAKHENGYFTLFVPTAPVPTSGITYHLPPECVELKPEISVEAAMRTVISCGAGSQLLFN